MKTVYLHVGFPKTGTTFLQYSLARNRALLAENRIYYHGMPESGLCANHWWFAIPFLDEPHSYFPFANDLRNGESLASLRERGEKSLRAWKEACSSPDYDLGIISAEQFLYLGGKGRDAVERMRACFEEQSLCTKIVCYVRDPLSYAFSELNQKVKMGIYSFKEVRKNPSLVVPDYGALNIYSEVFGAESLLVRPYSTLPRGLGGILSDFLDQLDPGYADLLESMVLESGSERNASLTYGSLLALDCLNPHLLAPPNSAARDLLLMVLEQVAPQTGQPWWFAMDPVLRLAIVEAARAKCSLLKSLYRIDYESIVEGLASRGLSAESSSQSESELAISILVPVVKELLERSLARRDASGGQ
jgi:hypothetical protein